MYILGAKIYYFSIISKSFRLNLRFFPKKFSKNLETWKKLIIFAAGKPDM